MEAPLLFQSDIWREKQEFIANAHCNKPGSRQMHVCIFHRRARRPFLARNNCHAERKPELDPAKGHMLQSTQQSLHETHR